MHQNFRRSTHALSVNDLSHLKHFCSSASEWRTVFGTRTRLLMQPYSYYLRLKYISYFNLFRFFFGVED